MQRCLFVDIETYCELELGEVGVHVYAAHPSFKILLFGYAIDDEPINVIQYKNMDSSQISSLLKDSSLIKVAHNARFEHTCLAKWWDTPIEEWEDTMVMCAQNGFPQKLDLAVRAMNMPQLKADGKALIRLFSMPQRNGKRCEPEQAPEKWKEFIEYNRQDVLVERNIYKELVKFGMDEKELFAIDWHINNRGVNIDANLAKTAIRFAGKASGKAYEALMAKTGLSRPTDNAIKGKYGITSLEKRVIPQLYKERPELTEILDLRGQLSKTSIQKYEAMLRCRHVDGRAKGLAQFYGAGRTGRWSGRLIQLQNLPQIHINEQALATARSAVASGDNAIFECLYGDDSLSVLSQLIRTALIPSIGCSFVVADFSAIEARILAWLADEHWRLDVFRGAGKIYETSAERMFNLPPGSVTKDSPMRQKGKIAELALGYGGAVGALTRMGALTMGLDEAELPTIVWKWRRANPAITAFWKSLDTAFCAALEYGKTTEVNKHVRITRENGPLQIQLPNGRYLTYQNARWNGKEVMYMGVNQVTNKWEEQDLYGAKATENVVQAMARDCLARVIVYAEKRGLRPVFHVHDEIICEVSSSLAEASLKEILNVMAEPPSWAPGLPIKGDGFICAYYRK